MQGSACCRLRRTGFGRRAVVLKFLLMPSGQDVSCGLSLALVPVAGFLSEQSARVQSETPPWPRAVLRSVPRRSGSVPTAPCGWMVASSLLLRHVNCEDRGSGEGSLSRPSSFLPAQQRCYKLRLHEGLSVPLSLAVGVRPLAAERTLYLLRCLFWTGLRPVFASQLFSGNSAFATSTLRLSTRTAALGAS